MANKVVVYKSIAFTFNPYTGYVEFSNGDMIFTPNGYNGIVKNRCLKHIDAIYEQETRNIVSLYLN